MGKKQKIAIAMLLAISVAGATSASLAWFDITTPIQPGGNLVGVSEGAYFAYGTGSADDPFGIETPRQLYNLSWLQYLGLIDDVSGGTTDECYFELNANVDMTDWVIPPIGTEDNPFMGHFDGQGYSISNLTVSDALSQFSAHPDTVTNFKQPHILGLFGVVGPYHGSDKSYSSATDAIANLIVSGITVKPTVSTALTGMVAGYVNGPISHVGVSDAIQEDHSVKACKLDLTANVTPYVSGQNIAGNAFSQISEFGTIGYAESEYVGHAKKTVSTMKGYTRATNDNLVVQDSGQNAGWGGSIDMKTTYNGLRIPWDTFDSNVLYDESTGIGVYKKPTTKTWVENIAGETISGPTYGGWEAYNPSSGFNYYGYRQKDGNYTTSQYTFAHDGGTRYMYLYGEEDKVFSNQVTVNRTYYENLTETFHISREINDTTHYLSLSNGALADVRNDEASATSWYLDGDGYFFTTINNTTTYYLRNNNGSLAVTTAQGSASIWDYDTSKSVFSTKNGNTKYCLYYDNGWTLKTVSAGYYTFKSGNYYLQAQTDSYRVTQAQNTNNDLSHWYVDSSGHIYPQGYTNLALGYYDSTDSIQTNYYSDNKSFYTIDEANGHLKTTYNGSTYYAYYNYGWTAATTVRSITISIEGAGDPSAYALDKTAGTSFYRPTTDTTSKEDYTLHLQSTYFPLRQESSGTPELVGYYFRSNGYYLVFDTSVTNNLRASQNEGEATVWLVNNGYYYPRGYKTYYLNRDNGTTFRCTTATYRRFTWSNNRLSESNSYYAYVNNGNWVLSRTAQTTYRDDYTETPNIPNGVPANTNTGYIIGGASTSIAGSIRVSQYFGPGSNDNNLNGSSVSNGRASLNTVYTIQNDNLRSTTISTSFSDTYANSKTKFENLLSEDASNIYGLHFVAADIEYGKTYDSDGVTVLSDKSAYAGKAIVNGTTYYNYEMPTNCIDFNLKEKGYINFIAGAYYSGNNTFFCIKEVQRNPNSQAIDNIREIAAVYKDSNDSHSYVYEYKTYDNNTDNKRYSTPFMYVGGEKKTLSGGDYTEYSSVASLPSGYNTKAFNCSWISSKASLQTTANDFEGYPYYFEIPMNAGEYCMGSPTFSGASGAYLMYLDIGANAAKMTRTSITEFIQEVTKSFDYPLGIALVATGTTAASVDALNSFCIVVGNRNSGAVTLSRTATATGTATNSDGSNAISIGYYHDQIAVTNGSGGALAEATVPTDTTNISRVTYYDYNSAEGKVAKIIVTKKVVNGGTPTYTSERYVYRPSNPETTRWVEDDTLVLYNDQGVRITDLSNTVISDVSGNTTVLSFKNLYLSTGTLQITYGLDGSMVQDGTGQYFVVSGYSINVKYTDTSGNADLTDRLEIVSVVASYNSLTITFKINGETVSNAAQIITVTLSAS